MADPQLTRDIKWYDAYGVNLKGDLVIKKGLAETSWRAKTSEINVGPCLLEDEKVANSDHSHKIDKKFGAPKRSFERHP